MMPHAERCPVCCGRGTIVSAEPPTYSTTMEPQPKTCHGCYGRGWVEVSDPRTFRLCEIFPQQR